MEVYRFILGRPFLKRFALCYRTVVLSCLSVCPVMSVTFVYCGQTVGWIKTKLGTQVGLCSGHTVLDEDPAPPPLKRHSHHFSAHICWGQMAGWIKMPLCKEVGLDPSIIVLDGDPAPLPKKGTEPPIFGPCLLWPNGLIDQDDTWHVECPCTLQWAALYPLNIVPSRGAWGVSEPPSNIWFPSPTEVHNPNYISNDLAVFAQLTAVGRPFFAHNSPLSWGLWTSSNTWFLGSTRAHNPNGILIGSAVFAEMTAECPYTLQWNALPPQNMPFP